MRAAAKANGTAGSVKRQTNAPETADTPAAKGRFLGFKDRLLVRSDAKGAPVLVRAWQQAAVVFGGAALTFALAGAAFFGLSNHKALVLADMERRDAEIRVALDLVSEQLTAQQTALFDSAAMERGLIFVDATGIDIKTLMAENERLLSTLEAALSLTDTTIEEGVAGEEPQIASLSNLNETSSEDLRVLARELELSHTKRDLLEAELLIERQTIDKMADELATARQETRAL